MCFFNHLMLDCRQPLHVVQEEQQEEEEESDDEETAEQKLSKRKRKEANRLKIAELKQTCPRPEVVEVWDVTAQDPKLLVYLKASSSVAPACACCQNFHV
jgi:splicing factor 3B subunit 2